jgi:phosphatidylglycerol:prolipoprotein diacylglycerol transferase
MYPRLSDILQDLFGFSLPIPIYSFGAMLAVAFLVGAWLLRKELNRLYRIGRVGSVTVPVPDAKDSKKKRRTTQQASPAALLNTVTIIAVVAGIVGSKLFHILENLDLFFRDPFGMIFSTGGLTFYGGLITAGLALAYYLRKKKVALPAFADAVAPSLMLAYGIGRIGCYLAGDGDWGVCSHLENKPDWLPTWLWTETFPNNIIGAGGQPVDVIQYNVGQGDVCAGADGVFPTMLYEFTMAAVLFGILWAVRKHPFKSGWLFSLYLVFAGVERFFIEQIRVNNEFLFLGMTVTQAEVISVLIILTGLVGLALTTRKYMGDPAHDQPVEVSSAVV